MKEYDERLPIYNEVKMNKEYTIINRADGRAEWVCEHGIGHTIFVPPEFEHIDAWWVHGCDGCCSVQYTGFCKSCKKFSSYPIHKALEERFYCSYCEKKI